MLPIVFDILHAPPVCFGLREDDEPSPFDVNGTQGDCIAITGCMGCLGAWTVRLLLDEGVRVVGLDESTNSQRLQLLLSSDELDARRALLPRCDRPSRCIANNLRVGCYASDSLRGFAGSFETRTLHEARK